MTIQEFTQLLTGVGAIATPIILLVLTGIGWTIRQRIEINREQEKYLRELEEKLRVDRINIYKQVLKPFILLIKKDIIIEKGRQIDSQTKGLEIFSSVEYRETAFHLALVGSDGVVDAYNKLMQFVYNDLPQNNDTKQLLYLLGNWLLEIRKSMGNTNTVLNEWDMLSWLVKKINYIKEQTRA